MMAGDNSPLNTGLKATEETHETLSALGCLLKAGHQFIKVPWVPGSHPK